MESIFYYLVTGLAAGIFAGMLGIGGGVVAVPLLIMIFTAQDFPAEIVVHLYPSPLKLLEKSSDMRYKGVYEISADQRREEKGIGATPSG